MAIMPSTLQKYIKKLVNTPAMDLLDTQPLSYSNRLPEGAVCVIIEGQHGAGKTSLVDRLISERVVGECDVSNCLWGNRIPNGWESTAKIMNEYPPDTRAAFYVLSNFEVMRRICLQTGAFVLDRNYCSTRAHALGSVDDYFLKNTLWPEDLPMPTHLVYLEASEAVRMSRLTNNSSNITTRDLRKRDAKDNRIADELRLSVNYLKGKGVSVTTIDVTDMSCDDVFQTTKEFLLLS